MKNSTILKDELRLLTADKSAVITELRESGIELKNLYTKIGEEETRLEDVRNTITEETARLDYIRSRAVSVQEEQIQYTQDLDRVKRNWEKTRVKNSQEEKIHLGRIKELKKKEEGLTQKISELKDQYDRNSLVYTQHVTEKKSHLRSLDEEIEKKSKQAKSIEEKLKKDLEEDKKLTKDRLKREDKIRAREKALDIKARVQEKKEEDLITMSKDIVIVYGRLKEYYAKVDPTVDLDRLILNAI